MEYYVLLGGLIHSGRDVYFVLQKGGKSRSQIFCHGPVVHRLATLATKSDQG
jgi:hypothetical protein